MTSKPPPKPVQKPNRNTMILQRGKYIEKTKAEMQEDLRKAVENTK